MAITATGDILRLSSDADDQHQIDLLALMTQTDHQNHHYHNSTFHIDPSPHIDAPSPLIYNYNPSSDMQSYTYPSVSHEKMKTFNLSSMESMREMMFGIAVMQPVHIDPEAVKAPKRRNVKISKDPQSVAARRRRERISERIRILQRLVPGGTKMDTASMLDEAVHYVKFLKKQVRSLERVGAANVNLLKDSCQPPPPSHMVVGAVLRQQVFN